MKKILSVFLFISVLFGFCTIANAKSASHKKPKTKQKIELITKDKFILVGDFYLPDVKTDKPLVVLLHSFALSASSWSDIAQDLRKKGYNVLAMDLRGHGRSTYSEKLKFKSRYTFQEQDWQKLPSDVIDSINYIKNNYAGVNTTNVIIAGADIGANAGVIAGTLMRVPPDKFVLISPMYEFKGLKMPVGTTRIQNSKILIILSKSDKVLFDFNVKIKPVIKKYEKGGPGIQLIKFNPAAKTDIINFIVN